MKKKEPSEGLRSGELAHATGVSADTLRHYERRGLLAPPRRRSSGYRSYRESAVVRVRLIQKGMAIGFTLDELAGFLRERDAGGAPCHGVRALAERKLQEVELRVGELSRFRDDLRKLLRDWDRRLAAHDGHEPLRFLESLEPRDRAAAAALSESRFARRPGRRRREA